MSSLLVQIILSSIVLIVAGSTLIKSDEFFDWDEGLLGTVGVIVILSYIVLFFSSLVWIWWR